MIRQSRAVKFIKVHSWPVLVTNKIVKIPVSGKIDVLVVDIWKALW